jgi:hypothetical protein
MVTLWQNIHLSGRVRLRNGAQELLSVANLAHFVTFSAYECLCRIWLYGIKARRRWRRAGPSRWHQLGRPGAPACRSALGRAPGGAARQGRGRSHRRHTGPNHVLGDERQAVTIAELVGLLKLVAAIGARHRSASPAIEPDTRRGTDGPTYRCRTIRASDVVSLADHLLCRTVTTASHASYGVPVKVLSCTARRRPAISGDPLRLVAVFFCAPDFSFSLRRGV